MILIIKTKHNLLDQKIYDFFIDYIKKHRETFFCSVFGSDCDIIFYGTYQRHFVTEDDISRMSIKLQRVYDKKNHQSHVLLPYLLIPYSIIPLPYQIKIIKAPVENLPMLSVLYNLDPRALLYIRNIFRSFWVFLDAFLNVPLETLVISAYHSTGRQFMQTRGYVHLYSPT